MDFIDTYEPGRKLSFLVYPDDIPSGVSSRAAAYTRQSVPPKFKNINNKKNESHNH